MSGVFPKIKKSLFNLSHDRKMSLKFGKLYPVLVEDVLPNDSWQMRPDMLMRFAPMLSPVMHEISSRIDYFFVPNRILWSDWENFITTGEDGLDTSVMPKAHVPVEAGHWDVGSLWDYMGLPTGIDGLDSVVTSLPFRAYRSIWNEWYRDQDLQEKYSITNDDAVNMELLSRNWEKDYFTSARPDTQKGPATVLPIGDTAPVTGTAADPGYTGNGNGYLYADGDPNNPLRWSNASAGAPFWANTPGNISGDAAIHLVTPARSFNVTGIADLSDASGTGVDAIRLAFQVNFFRQLNMRYGNRYAEYLMSHWGVFPEDYRLQRPEYLGGITSPVKVSEVLQTSAPTSGQTPLATMGGHGYSPMYGNNITYKAKEHGWIIALLSVVPRTAYSQGIPRRYLRDTWTDYAVPEFAHLGEQAVQIRELYAAGNKSTPFGYQGRFDEYRRRESSIHGDFRTSLDFWHLSRKFESEPALNDSFIRADNADDRIFAVQNGTDYLWCHIMHNNKVVRALPAVGIPSLLDHGSGV